MEAVARILVVEDHGVLGRFIAATLTGVGWNVIGPIRSQASAIDAVRRRSFDCAIIDRMLQGEEAFAVADAVLARNRRLLLISGYARSTLPERFRDTPFLEKPFSGEALVAAVSALAAQR